MDYFTTLSVARPYEYSVELKEDGWMMNAKEFVRKLSCPNWDTIPAVAWRDWAKSRRSSVRKAVFPFEIRPEQFPSTSLNRYQLLTPWSWALLEKPLVAQLLKNIPIFYGTRMFTAVFNRALQWSLSWSRPIQSVALHSISPRSILILSTHILLGLPSGLYPSGFPTEILHAFLFPPCVLHALTVSSSF
jgi:hypothetical protein